MKIKLLMAGLLVGVMAVSAQAALQVHLPLDGNLTDVANGHTVTLTDGVNGSTSFVTGQVGASAIRLVNPVSTDLGTDYVGINYTLTDEGAISLWYTPESLYNYQTVFCNSVSVQDFEMWVYVTGELAARIQEPSYTRGFYMTAGVTYHIAWTWNRDDTNPAKAVVYMYIDGVEVVQDLTHDWTTPGNTVFFGGGIAVNGSANHGANAIFDDFRIYDHTLSAAEVAVLAIPEQGTRSLVFEPSELSLDEGSSSSYTVALAYSEGAVPESNVDVTITPDSEVALDGFPAGDPVTLTFESGSFTTAQAVQVMAVDDSVDTGNRISALLHSVSSGDALWGNMAEKSLSVYIFEDDEVLDCGAWGYLEMDSDENCYVDLVDFAKFASQWLSCTHPLDSLCISPPDVTIVAHRGYSAISPENTIASCNASRSHAGAVEFDVRTTVDQHLILMHDSTVDRTTDGSGTPEAMTFSDIRLLDAGSWYSPGFTGELVPTFNEAILAILPDMIPCIERKSGTPEQYVEILDTLRCASDVVVISFDWDFLASLEALDSTIVTGALGSNDLTIATINNIKSKGIDFIDWENSVITADEVALVHFSGLELWVWTVNDMGRVQELIDLGVDGITTDFPEAASQILEQQ